MTKYVTLLMLLLGVSQAQTGVLDPTKFPGSDIGAQIKRRSQLCGGFTVLDWVTSGNSADLYAHYCVY
jgi:hypothetical protein